MKLPLTVHPEIGPPDTDSPWHLVFASRLPDVCAKHGRDAVEHRDQQLTFYRTRRGGRQVNALRLILRLLTIWQLSLLPRIDPDIVVHAQWPVCPACLAPARVYRAVGTALIALAALNVVALLLMTAAYIRPPSWLALAIFPGWIPFGLLVIMFLFRSGETFVLARISPDLREADIVSHPRFDQAVAGELAE
ncbi:hypothetical protein [Nocardia sp. NPDC019395]|uniref:hypothetical protein n=1 Tax=Nocardia sp. NPDC019395 TaxID=3154686 RepID=UPI0033CE7E12